MREERGAVTLARHSPGKRDTTVRGAVQTEMRTWYKYIVTATLLCSRNHVLISCRKEDPSTCIPNIKTTNADTQSMYDNQ
jgi:hypothetical protein